MGALDASRCSALGDREWFNFTVAGARESNDEPTGGGHRRRPGVGDAALRARRLTPGLA
jgi:hypothetical protein